MIHVSAFTHGPKPALKSFRKSASADAYATLFDRDYRLPRSRQCQGSQNEQSGDSVEDHADDTNVRYPLDPPDPPDPTAIRDRLRSVVDPVLRSDILSLGLVDDVHVTNRCIGIALGLYAPYAPSERHIVDRIHHAFRDQDREVLILANPTSSINGIHSRYVRNVVPIVSVDQPIDDRDQAHDINEKTHEFVVSNLAVAVARTGAKVGVLQISKHPACQMQNWETAPPSTATIGGPARIQGVLFARIDPASDTRTHLIGDATREQSQKPSTGALNNQRRIEAIDWGGLDYLFIHKWDGKRQPTASDHRQHSVGPVLLTGTDTEHNTVLRRVAAYSRSGHIPIGMIPVGRPSISDERSTKGSIVDAFEPTVFPLLPGSIDGRGDGTSGSAFETVADDTITSARHLLTNDHSLAPHFDSLAAAVIEAVGARQRRQHAGLLSA